MTKKITLETPIKRGETEITEIEVLEPTAGQLAGVSLADLLQLDVSALLVVLPRLTQPTLTPHEAANLSPADLLSLGSQVTGFLLPKSAMA